MSIPLPRYIVSYILSLIALVSLQGCGGGGGGSNPVTATQVPLWMVFRADKEADEIFELYSVLDDGSNQPVKLSPSTTVSGVGQFSVSPNGVVVAFTVREDSDNNGVIDFNDDPAELFWAPVDGSVPATNISGALPAHAAILAFDWSPDSSRLVFRSDIDTDDVDELYMVEMNNATPVKINGNVGTTVEMGAVIWSPDSRYVAQVVRNRENRFISDRVAINVHDTLGNPGNSTRVSGPTLTGSFFSGQASGANISAGITWSPDSSRLAYMLDDRSADTRFHYQAFPDGTNQRVTGSLAANVRGGLGFAWSGDSRYLAYELATLGVGANVIETYDTINRTVDRIVTAPNGGRIIGRSDSIQWQPQGNRIAVAMSQSTGGPLEMFIVSVDNIITTPTPASGVLAANTTVNTYNWSPDGSRLAYLTRDTVDGTSRLFTVLPDQAPINVSHDSVGTSQNEFAQWLPGSDRLLYGFGDDFYTAAADTADAFTLINAGLDIDIPSFGFTFQSASAATTLSAPGANKIGLLALQPGTGSVALYTSNADGSALKDISGGLVQDGNVTGFAFARSSIF